MVYSAVCVGACKSKHHGTAFACGTDFGSDQGPVAGGVQQVQRKDLLVL